MKFGVTEDLVIRCYSVVEKLIRSNEPITSYSLEKEGINTTYGRCIMLALTRSYTKSKNGFNFPKFYENADGYFRKVYHMPKPNFLEGLRKAMTYEFQLGVCRRELKKKMKEMV